MNVGILNIGVGECISDAIQTDTNRVSDKLCKHGYFVTFCIEITESDRISETFSFLQKNCDAIVICGDIEKFYTVISERFAVNRSLATFMLEETPCAVSAVCDDSFTNNMLLPMLNSQCKTFYSTAVFRTIGKNEEQLRISLKEYIKNRNKIIFKFDSCPPECVVSVRYSHKTQKSTVAELLAGVRSVLKDCTYSYDENRLPETVAELLMKTNKTLGLAESFTGGNIAASLVAVPGISRSLKEGIVCYANETKQNRLRVSSSILDNYGAVSVETAYEMAANLLMDGHHDYVVATTGNAGPTSEKPDEVGVCYIAVGDKRNIDIFPYRFRGDRQSVIHSGTLTALYHLYKFVSDTVLNESQTKENV